VAALNDPVITLVGLMKIDMPGGEVRLCDGGRAMFDSGSGAQEYLSAHSVWGTIAGAEEIEDAINDSAPGGGLALSPAPSTPLSTIINPALQFCRVRFWLGLVDADMVTVSNAIFLGDKLIDVPTWHPDAWRLDFELIDRTERLFLRNEGNVCSSAFHQSIWPGERGFDNCTDTPGQVAWGTESTPSGTAYGTGSGVGGGGGGGSRSFSERMLNELQ